MKLSVELDDKDWVSILNHLSERPFREVNGLIGSITGQLNVKADASKASPKTAEETQQS